ncbi:hypothetical protein COU61_01295 [Candidatus Pacearchaeota archaeon CG10_big_fil_rev_8_21_14_0_10_35_13]|nr:MAG: hypothetical protein COU61_01295 [Candidatus Pacearchaeota archaeon CG10_big_fil_rev_8_21_14_0_10_35_13]
MMKIIDATIEYSKEISELMLYDLKSPNPKFPQEMINSLREHAQEGSVRKEFDNPELISFLALDGNTVVGFIVGYKNAQENNAMIHYITSRKSEVKDKLLKEFVMLCKLKGVRKIITDTFEFMDNNEFFKKSGFVLVKKENITLSLEMLWYELIMKH